MEYGEHATTSTRPSRFLVEGAGWSRSPALPPAVFWANASVWSPLVKLVGCARGVSLERRKECVGRRSGGKKCCNGREKGRKEELLKLRVIPIALQPPQQYHSYSHSCLRLSTFSPNPLLWLHSGRLAWPAATIPTTCTPSHAPPSSHPLFTPQASAAICNLHPAGSFASQQPPKRASPQKARPGHALSSLQPSRPITHLALELQSVGFILSFHSLSCSIVFHGVTRVLHHFTLHSSLPKSIGGRSRGESNPTITQLPPGTSASKSLKIDHGGHPN